jgi:beta-mannosidase
VSARFAAAFVVFALGARGEAKMADAASATKVTMRTRTEITQGWTFVRAPHKDERTVNIDETRRPATVPGCVHTDLLAAGQIGDPFYRLNEKDQQWIENESWDYDTTLPIEAATLARDHVELVFAGIDTFGDVYVNGKHVLTANNMFRSWRVDVKAHLRPGNNVLKVLFWSPIAKVKPAYDKLGYKLPAANDQGKEMVSMWARKAPYHYGWDWGPRFVTSGIWRPVALEAWDEARLDDVQVFQNKLDANAAELGIVARIVAARAGKARVTVAQPGGPTLGAADVALEPGVNDVKLGARIDKPELWWPAGLGAQRLYTLETKLTGADGKPRDARTTRIGLRTIEVVHQRDAEGKSFFIKVNGAPVFMKGANWIPADSFVTRVTPERYRFLLQSAVDANMNMLRVWGGGIYEDDRFYDLADEMGLLVWQDFMFACSMYPGDDAFVENVRREAIENVRRLRNHPSLALWAGNNENEAAWKQWGWQIKFALPKKAQDRIWADYQRMFHQVLPAVVAAEDPGRFYTRSSPSANDDKVPPNKRNWGDMHFWGVWHAENPYEAYADNISRFMSEYGFQSFPELASVKRYTAPDGSDWNIESPVMLSHQRHPRGNPLIRTYMDRDFHKPKDFASFLYVGQVLQGIVIKYAAEAHRRAMGHNWGSLYWQLDDCWPVASWSSIDYYGRWKAEQYFARKFYAPVLVSPVLDKGVVTIYGVSDHRADARAKLAVRLLDFAGNVLTRFEQPMVLAANSSRPYMNFKEGDILKGADPSKVVLVTELSLEGAPGGPTSRNLLFFKKTKDLQLPKPDVKLAVTAGANGTLAVSVGARQLARNVFLASGAVDGFFDDNYFDVLPGETVTVSFRPRAPTTPAALQAALTATSIADTY